MQSSHTFIFHLLIISGVLGIIAIVIGFRLRKIKHSRLLTAVFAMPAKLMLAPSQFLYWWWD
jgi:hypothetical protein